MAHDFEAAGPGKKLIDAAPPTLLAGRVASVDGLRGLTILLMVFVNDLGRAAPSWMLHIQPPRADGMTLADVVFPVFLFLVGVSIPLAFEQAEKAGKSKWAQLAHVLVRTVSLLLMGLIEFNSADDRTLGGPLWRLLAYTALILAWCTPVREHGRKRTFVMAVKGLGFVGLLILLAIYRREPGPAEIPLWGRVEDWVWLRTGWWGILGLIGWAYGTVCLLVLLLGWRREWLMGALALLMVLHLALNHGGLFTRVADKPWLGAATEPLEALARGIETVSQYVSLRDATGSLAAITMAGCLLGTILRRDSELTSHAARIGWAATFAVGLFLAGCLTDTFEGINKIAATPTWCLWCSALACVVWIVLCQALDATRTGVWLMPLRAAGANPLVAYFLHPIVVQLIVLVGMGDQILGYKQATDPLTVVGGSLAMAVFICAVAGLVGRLGLRMRL
jgi:predicted acyltransferase